MSDTTCNYNKTHGLFTRSEIRMLAQALGLPEERIEEKLNKAGMGPNIRTSELLHLIDDGVFAMDFHRLYNSQSGRYNSVVFGKALQLVDAHLFSFDEILKARLAFDVYEMNALRNDKNNSELILQTIRFCDYRISRLKLEHRLRHFDLNDTKVLHLCEYFDLLLLCNRDKNSLQPLTKKKIDVANPKPVDQQVMDEMNMKYLRDERNWFFEEKFAKPKVLESAVWPAKVLHQRQIDEASIRKSQLQRELSASISSLKQSRAGSACSTHSHLSSAALRRSRAPSDCSFTSLTPIINRDSNNSSVQSTRAVMPEIKEEATEISNRIEQLRVESAFSALKYAVRREDYMNELFPNGYSKPVTTNKPVERRRIKKPRPSVYWSRRTAIK